MPKKSALASKYPRLADIYNKLEKQNAAIYDREQQLASVEKEFAGAKGIFKAKQRKELQEQHAIETAKAFNAMNPEYIGMLTLMVEPGAPLYDWVRDGKFQLLTQPQVLRETRLLVENLDSPGSVFRMNHASNYLVLKGTLNQDKEVMLRTIDAAEHDLSRLRPEEWRGL